MERNNCLSVMLLMGAGEIKILPHWLLNVNAAWDSHLQLLLWYNKPGARSSEGSRKSVLFSQTVAAASPLYKVGAAITTG